MTFLAAFVSLRCRRRAAARSAAAKRRVRTTGTVRGKAWSAWRNLLECSDKLTEDLMEE